jgi:group I intron endonuclease
MKKDSTIEWAYFYNKPGIYKITNTINGKLYIGLTGNLSSRFNGHVTENRNNTTHNPHLKNALNKYGTDNFIYSPILVCEKEELERYEIALIKLYKTQDREYGYNANPGGKRLFGKNSSQFGKKRTQEWKDMMSKRMSGKNSPSYGKVNTRAIKAASEHNSIPVIQLDKQGNFIKEFSSITEAAKEVGIGKSSIAHVCKGDKYRHTAKGYKWEYKTIKANIEIKN